MLGVEYRQMLVSNRFHTVASHASRELRYLLCIQIVRRRNPIQAGSEERVGGQGVRCVQTEVPRQRRFRSSAERVGQTSWPDQKRAFQPQQELRNPLLSRLQDSRSSYARRDPRILQ